MVEYKLVMDLGTTCQKLLNQWKHEFTLDILFMAPYQASEPEQPLRTFVMMLVARTRKEG